MILRICKGEFQDIYINFFVKGKRQIWLPAWIWNYEHQGIIIHCCSVSCFLLACLSVMAALEHQFCWECVWQQPDRFPRQNQHEAGISTATARNSTRHPPKAGPKVVIPKIYLSNFSAGPLEMFFSLQTCCWSKLSNGMWATDFLSRHSWVILLLCYAEAAGL